jgi:hypothetical protein
MLTVRKSSIEKEVCLCVLCGTVVFHMHDMKSYELRHVFSWVLTLFIGVSNI